jgi:hypothetical protein
MVDAFTDFFDERPATHINGSKQIDLISVSRRLAPYIDRAFILSPAESEADHSSIGIDFDFGALTSHGDLSGVDPGHAENRNLISTDVKASTAFIDLVKKKNTEHNATNRMHGLFERCERTGRCTDCDRRKYQDLCNVLYSHAKTAEKECKKVGGHAWSRMLAAAGWMVQYANEEFRRLKNHEQVEPGVSNEYAFVRAKQNQIDAYTEIH